MRLPVYIQIYITSLSYFAAVHRDTIKLYVYGFHLVFMKGVAVNAPSTVEGLRRGWTGRCWSLTVRCLTPDHHQLLLQTQFCHCLDLAVSRFRLTFLVSVDSTMHSILFELFIMNFLHIALAHCIVHFNVCFLYYYSSRATFLKARSHSLPRAYRGRITAKNFCP